MLKMFWSVIKVFVDFLKIPFFMLLFCFVVFCCFCTYFFIKKLLSGSKMPKLDRNAVHKTNLLIKLFWEVPKQFVEDIFSREVDFFGTQGLIIFEGRQR